MNNQWKKPNSPINDQINLAHKNDEQKMINPIHKNAYKKAQLQNEGK